jgi:hypothetical protein
MMRAIWGVALVMVVVAPFVGRWRAKLWLKKHILMGRQITHLPPPQLHEPRA